MKRLVIVRHGATESNVTGVMRGWTEDGLTDLGKLQARQTAAALKASEPIEKIYTSTLPRSIETGKILAEALNAETEAIEDLRELNLGVMEGKSERELWGYFFQNAVGDASSDKVADLMDVNFPGGESVSQFLSRIEKALKSILASHPQGSVVIVWHGVAAMVALGKWLEPSVSQWPKFRLDNCSITELLFDPKPSVVKLNDTSHLESIQFKESAKSAT